MILLRKILLTCGLLSLCVNLYAQCKDTDAPVSIENFKNVTERQSVSDAGLRIRYAFNAQDINDKSTWIDEGQLKIADHMTDYSSRFIEVNEDSLLVWFNNHPNYSSYPPLRWMQGLRPDQWIEYQYSQIITSGGELQEWCTMPRDLDTQNMYYVEPLPLMQWSLGSETDTICGYECFKATCDWRGRQYTAWFCPDIPYPYGPWKFGGLPGLILKIHDADHLYEYEAIAIESGSFPIYMPRGGNYSKVKRELLRSLQYDLNENYYKTTGQVAVLYKTGQLLTSRHHPYQQMELE